MKRLLIWMSACLLLTACVDGSSGRSAQDDSTAMTRSLFEKGQTLMADNGDSALVLLLNAVDYSKGCKELNVKYELFKTISQMYEQKNLSEQQQAYQKQMAGVAHLMNDLHKEADAHQRIAMTNMVLGNLDEAITEGEKALEMSSPDSLEFLSQTMLTLCQVFLQKEDAEAAQHYLDEAAQTTPAIVNTELYKLSHAYVLSINNKSKKLEELIHEYKTTGSVFLNAELMRLMMSVHEKNGRWEDAFQDASQLLQLTDSISQIESSESMARIHELQHEQQMEHNRAERETERATLFLLIIIVLLLLLAASVFMLIFRKRAIRAHANELEAMRLADEAQSSEASVREENILLQKLYYEHLFAIILPILNAHRGKTGHINLEESSWKLIESNTDMVLPGFTAKLRRNHPSLSTEDVRFCCMLMMRVPNVLLADVYGIAPSSVSIRKQRMKKRLDADVHGQTIEDYLNQYIV